MPNRRYSATNSYRYGFNGKENDNEVKGEGNEQDYGMRIYDTRLGRFLSVDPLSKQFPFYTPYQFAGNTPLWGVDLDGGELRLGLPRWLTFPDPILTFPKAPTIPMPTQPLPPMPPLIPTGFSMPQSPTLPQAPSIPNVPKTPLTYRNLTFDESTIDPNDATTYPTPPSTLKGDWKVTPIKPGTKGYEKLKDQEATRLENEEGDILRWHAPDKYHPKGHWDYKKGGSPNNPWENYTPDGIKIPEGKIYGKDFAPAIIMKEDYDGIMYGQDPKRVPAYLWDKYQKYKKNILDYNKRLEDYQQKLKEYQKQMEDYQHKMEKYEKQKADYYEAHKEIIV